jgi:hypothetical protein
VTYVPAHWACDHPGCDAKLPDDGAAAGERAVWEGWGGYWTSEDGGAELHHHCPEHPVPTRAGRAIDV